MKTFLVLGVFLVLASALDSNVTRSLGEDGQLVLPLNNHTVQEEDASEDELSAVNETETPRFNLSSENFPGPYPPKPQYKVIERPENYGRIEVYIEHLNIDPQKDQLRIYYGNVSSVDADPEVRLTGKLESPPMKIKVPNEPIITIIFVPNPDDLPKPDYDGYFLSYTFTGDIPKIPEPPPINDTIPEDELQTMTITLMVPETKQNNQTWDEFRYLLCNASNTYITAEHLNLEPCQKDNITFLDISKCLKTLPDSYKCVQVLFAIPLYGTAEENLEKVAAQPIPIVSGFKSNQVIRGMNSSDLEEMWNRYGRTEFQDAGYKEYSFPNTAVILGIWVGIIFGIALIFLLIVLTLCRCGIFRDYFSWMTETKDDEAMLQSELSFDHTKIPSPHQIFPEFMPTHTPNYLWDNIYDSQNPRFANENFERLTSPPDHEDEVILRRQENGGRQNVAFTNDQDGGNFRPNSRYAKKSAVNRLVKKKFLGQQECTLMEW